MLVSGLVVVGRQKDDSAALWLVKASRGIFGLHYLSAARQSVEVEVVMRPWDGKAQVGIGRGGGDTSPPDENKPWPGRDAQGPPTAFDRTKKATGGRQDRGPVHPRPGPDAVEAVSRGQGEGHVADYAESGGGGSIASRFPKMLPKVCQIR